MYSFSNLLSQNQKQSQVHVCSHSARHSSLIRGLMLAEKERLLITFSNDGTVRLWNIDMIVCLLFLSLSSSDHQTLTLIFFIPVLQKDGRKRGRDVCRSV